MPKGANGCAASLAPRFRRVAAARDALHPGTPTDAEVEQHRGSRLIPKAEKRRRKTAETVLSTVTVLCLAQGQVLEEQLAANFAVDC